MRLLIRNGKQALAIPPYSRLVSTIAIIPVKSFSGGKLRLASAIDDTRRQALGRALAGHVAQTLVDCDLVPLVVTGDPEVATWATDAGFSTIADPGTGLSDAVAAGVESVSQTRTRWIIFHADLPLLRPEDVDAVIDATGDVIAPSSDGGTSALSATRTIEFEYGPASFHRHLNRLDSPTVVARPGLLHDIDSPADLDSALHHPLGSWMSGYLQ